MYYLHLAYIQDQNNKNYILQSSRLGRADRVFIQFEPKGVVMQSGVSAALGHSTVSKFKMTAFTLIHLSTVHHIKFHLKANVHLIGLNFDLDL